MCIRWAQKLLSPFNIAWDWDAQQVGAEGVKGSRGLLHLCCGLSAYEFSAARREAREQGGAKQEERGTRSEAREQGVRSEARQETPSVRPSVCLSVRPSVRLAVCLSEYFVV